MISTSPLCPHVEQGSGASWLRSLPVKPKAVKVFSTGAAQEVKFIDPSIITVKRRWVPDQDDYLRQGAEGGRRFVREQAELEGVDILEGLNESVPTGNPDAIRLSNDFHLGFVEECVRRGVKPCILNVAVGNPEVTSNGQPWDGEVRLVATCVQAATDAGGYVGYHGYGPADVLKDRDWLAFRDVYKIDPLLRDAGVTGQIRWLHTEAGYDYVPLYVSGAWKNLVGLGYVSKQSILDGYERYAQVCKDLGVEMAFLFTFWGTQTWEDYEHADDDEVMEWYQNHLARNIVVPPSSNRRVVVAEGGLRFRARPTSRALILHVKPRGTQFTYLERIRSDGYDWFRCELLTGGTGGVPSGADPESGWAWCRADDEFSREA